MMLLGGLGGALLLIAQPLPADGDAPVAATAQLHFAPPVGRPMSYRVTTRRIGRDGSLINFSLVYALQWQRIGRGYQLDATLERIDSDAPPAVTRALTMMLQPLVGEPLAYLVAPDGSRIDLVDPDGLWERASARIQATGAEGRRAEAKQLAALIAALPAAERDRLATADVRALVASANGAIPVAGPADGASVSMLHGGALRTIARVESQSAAVGGSGAPLQIDHLWTVDTATGLVVHERRQSWIVEPGGDGRTLVEERVRALEPAS
ncbi:hypothetical protein [Sphingopyxis sp.]|jgi:hypothetical protein|uniref:hypothetical protein n=1 Tax=Sphingopyxis sp. TaxID=1908224 RepID=UPI003F700039